MWVLGFPLRQRKGGPISGKRRKLHQRSSASQQWGEAAGSTAACLASSAAEQRGTMTNVSNELVWSLVRSNNCFLHKRNGQTKR